MAEQQPHRSDLRAGIFILVSIVLVFAIIVAIKGVRTIFNHLETRDVGFSLNDDLGGLRVGDDVRIGGFKVGVVKSVEVDGLGDGEHPHIRVKFSMPEKYPLRKDAHIGIQSSVTGTTVLNIDSLGTGEMLNGEEELVGHPSSISQLLANVSEMTPGIRDIIAKVKTDTLPKIDADADKAGEALTSIREFSDRAKVASDQVGGLLGDSKSDLRGTFSNVHSITEDFKGRTPLLLDHADALIVKVTKSLDTAQGTLEDLKATAANARALSGSARSIVVDNRSRIDSMIALLKSTSENLRGASVEIRHSPWRLLYKPAPGELDNLTLFDAARQFADGAGNVSDAAEALKDASHDPQATPEQMKKLMQRLEDAFDNFTPVEQKLWNSVKN